MKKSLLALAALGMFAGAASAQSTVTLFGIVDAGIARLSAKTTTGSKSVTGMTNSGLNSSRLGFRGVEDLGGGMQAGFHIEGQLTNDDGNAAGQTWQRRSTVSLMGGFGEVRLGRDYTPNFWNTTIYDPFGTNGVGQSLTVAMIGAATATQNSAAAVRSNNSVSYFLPGNLGGFHGQVMVAFGENVSGGAKTNNYLGFRFGYAAGPLSLAGAYAKTEGATDAADTKYMNFGASYNMGFMSILGFVGNEKTGGGAKVQAMQIGVTVPLGQGELRAAYGDYDVSNSSNDWNKLALGYGYNLSKRTQMYTTFARVSNKGAQTKIVANNGLGFSGVTIAGGKAHSGFEFGVRHSF
ncbi:MAG: porin [Aquabacterium sp.]|nr:porin [Aquabacterium sp.]